MRRAPVPETSVEEDYKPSPAPHDIAAEPVIGQGASVDSEAIAQRVETTADLHFNASPSRLLGLHLPADLIAGRG